MCPCLLCGFPLKWRVIGFPNDLRVLSTDLAHAFKDLRPPSQLGDSVQFSAIDIPDCAGHKLAKTAEGHACLLIRTTEPRDAVPAANRLEHITVEHGLRALVH